MMGEGRNLHFRRDAMARGRFDVVVEPQAAGWTYAGLRVLTLAPGEPVSWSTRTCEAVVLPLAGGCDVACDGATYRLAGRPSVFEGITDFLYVPRDCELTLVSESGAQVALPTAEASRRLDVDYCPADRVPVEIRGAGQSSRQINNFLAPGVSPVEADKLVAVEVLTPDGNWSSYPPHKHDEARDGEAVLEEIYYFRLDGGPGAFGLHRVYTADGAIDLTAMVRDGDVVLVPKGYHGPSVSAPGYAMYYLNVLAGPATERTMTCLDDPAHHWIRQSWKRQEVDLRLPMTRVLTPQAAVTAEGSRG